MSKKLPLVVTVILSIVSFGLLAEHNHQAMVAKQSQSSSGENCQNIEITCAKTVTAAFAPNGDLWRIWVQGLAMYFQISQDRGGSFSAPKQVTIPAEKISARNENRPKIAFDNFSGVYLSWAMPREKKYTADIRFSYSADYGQTFSAPITVNNDNLLTGHSFNEMQVSANGEVSIVWLDGRLSYQLRKQGKKTNGSALFYASAQPRNNITTFSNQQLANGTCVCCRIATDYDQQGRPAIFWRHIYGDNIREFALLTLSADEDSQPVQISQDHWKINGCPHQGGGISIDQQNRYHLVWFNLGDQGKGIFYAITDAQGNKLTTPISIGDLAAQAAHPNIMQNNNVVDIVWTQFDGVNHQLWHQKSIDNGKSFSLAKKIATSNTGSDRPFIIKHAEVNYLSWQRPKQGHVVLAL
jgi:hypothetical protein